ncbi:MAG: transporter substrate-binding domain-containing protein, partial [Lentisphaerota bacterium]
MMTNTGMSGYTVWIFSRWIIALLVWLASGIFPANADSRVVTVGVYENAPKIFIDTSGKPAGIFIEIIEHIAENEGWRLQYTAGTWAEGLDRLERGEIDLMPDVAYTADRETIFAFHKVPVLSSWFQVYARKGSGIKSIMDLAGKRIVVLERSVQEEAFAQLATGFGLNITLISQPDYKDTFECVVEGKADAAITNRFYGLMHARKFGLEDTAIIFSPCNLFFAAPRQGRRPLLDAIDAHLSRLKKDPQSIYYQSLNRWTSEKVSYALPAWVKIAGLIVAGVLLLSLVGSYLLKRQVDARTRALSEQNAQMAKVNRALGESERKYRELLEHANSIILHWTHDGRITFLNEFGQRFFGYPEAEVVGRHVIGTIVPETESGERDLGLLIDQIRADPAAFEQNINENIRRNGERVWIAWTNKVYFDDHGRIKGILSIGSDITERKRAEEALRLLNTELEQRVVERTAALAEAMEKAQAADRIKSAFLATLSHELRTPLNSIIGFTGIMLQGLPGSLNEDQQKQMQMVQNSSRHLLALINDVLDISKIEAGQLSIHKTSFDLRSSIQKIVELVSPQTKQKGIELRLEIADDVTRATSDQRRMEQIILNLLNNAVKFTESGHVCVSCRTDDDQYILSVSDTGIGIRPEE